MTNKMSGAVLRRVGGSAAGLLAVVVVAFAIGEAMGWPFLAGPIESAMSSALHRPVTLLAGADGGARVRIRLLGGISVQAAQLRIDDRADMPGGPAVARPLLVADGVLVRLRWRGVLAGDALNVRELRASAIELHARRDAKGRANWDFSDPAARRADASAEPAPPVRVPRFERLVVERASGDIDDAWLALQARFEAGLDTAAAGQQAFSAKADGQWQKRPLTGRLQAASPLPVVAGTDAEPIAITATLEAGRSKLRFEGSVADLLRQHQLQGRFNLSGPSLALVGQAVRITLPSTPPFELAGRIEHATTAPVGVWKVDLQSGRVGSSDLAGTLAFDGRGIDPKGRGRLAGELNSRTLWLADLGPAIGAPLPGQPRAAVQDAARVLPQRTFDLPSLRAMDADVKLEFQTLHLSGRPGTAGDPKSAPLRPIAPLNTRVQLDNGVLRLSDLVAGLAQGRIEGQMTLDATVPNEPAKWQARLNVRNVRIEEWVPAVRERAVPWASGRLAGQISLDGRGRSTAELLGSADGHITLLWSAGTISHLAVEAMGLDIAQGIGRLLRGDEALPVTCGAAYLRVKNGRAEPAPAVVDTRDSTIWLEGAATLADEQLDLRATVAPKDRSPLALRTPLVLRGTFAAPQAGVQGGKLAQRLLPSALLALVNPLAALIPLFDGGDREKANTAAAACARLTAGSYPRAGKPPTAAPKPAS